LSQALVQLVAPAPCHGLKAQFSPPPSLPEALVLVLLYCCETHSESLGFSCRQGLFPHREGQLAQRQRSGANFDKKVRVCPSDLLTLVSKTVQYLRDSGVPRRNNVKETDGRSSAGRSCRRNGPENCCRR